MKSKRRAPEIVLRNGKLAAVILDIDEYQEMLERLEDLHDLKTLRAMRKRPLKFRRLRDSLKEDMLGGVRSGSSGKQAAVAGRVRSLGE